MQECRPKQSSQNLLGSAVNGSQKNGKKNGAREKSSVSSESDLSANGDTLTANVNTPLSAYDDEAFDSPGELTSQQNSPSAMRRSTSLASADVPHRKLITASKTPPPTRKISSPENGKQSLHRRMRHFIPKRHNSGKSRAMSDVATQTSSQLSRSGTPDGNRTPTLKSFLYPNSPGSPYTIRSNRGAVNGQLPSGRLGSAGEEIDSAGESPLVQPSQTNNNHIIVRVPTIRPFDSGEVSRNLEEMKLTDHEQGTGGSSLNRKMIKPIDPGPGDFESSRSSQSNVHQSLANLNSLGRRDSGLSGCSTFTSISSERSIPATPILVPDNHSAYNSVQLSAKTFKFESTFSYEEFSKNGSPNIVEKEMMSLREENLRLREANTFLQNRLNIASEYAQSLEKKLKEAGVQVLNTCHVSPE